MTAVVNKVVWYAPTWSTAPKQWWVLRKYLLSAGPLVRITIASLIVGTTIVAGLKIAFPGIVIPNLLPMLLVLPGLVAALAAQTALLSILKARIAVTRQKVVVSHGQTATVIKMEWLTGALLTVHDQNRFRLRIGFTRQGRSRFVNVGLEDSAILFKLIEILPVEIVTRDARGRRSGDS